LARRVHGRQGPERAPAQRLVQRPRRVLPRRRPPDGRAGHGLRRRAAARARPARLSHGRGGRRRRARDRGRLRARTRPCRGGGTRVVRRRAGPADAARNGRALGRPPSQASAPYVPSAARSPGPIGSSIPNAAPRAEGTSAIVPAWAAISARTMARPRPVPPRSRAVVVPLRAPAARGLRATARHRRPLRHPRHGHVRHARPRLVRSRAGRGAGAPTVVLAVMTVLVGRFVSSPNGAVAIYCRRIGLYVNVRKGSASSV